MGWVVQSIFIKFFSSISIDSTTGKTQEGGKSANVLQELQIPVISNDQCSADYEAIGKKISDKQFDDAVLCAGYREG